jgi:hypothetical protein
MSLALTQTRPNYAKVGGFEIYSGNICWGPPKWCPNIEPSIFLNDCGWHTKVNKQLEHIKLSSSSKTISQFHNSDNLKMYGESWAHFKKSE